MDLLIDGVISHAYHFQSDTQAVRPPPHQRVKEQGVRGRNAAPVFGLPTDQKRLASLDPVFDSYCSHLVE